MIYLGYFCGNQRCINYGIPPTHETWPVDTGCFTDYIWAILFTRALANSCNCCTAYSWLYPNHQCRTVVAVASLSPSEEVFVAFFGSCDSAAIWFAFFWFIGLVVFNRNGSCLFFAHHIHGCCSAAEAPFFLGYHLKNLSGTLMILLSIIIALLLQLQKNNISCQKQ